jgi:hypothetical protein
MAGVPVPLYQQFWADRVASLEKEFQSAGKTHPDATEAVANLMNVGQNLEHLTSSDASPLCHEPEW